MTRILIELYRDDGTTESSGPIDLAPWQSVNLVMNIDGKDNPLARVTALPDSPVSKRIDTFLEKIVDNAEAG